MIFRAPAFSDVTNPRTFQPLESTLAEYLRSVALYSVQSDTVIIASGTDFNRSDVSKYDGNKSLYLVLWGWFFSASWTAFRPVRTAAS
jgi:hypothetical protein